MSYSCTPYNPPGPVAFDYSLWSARYPELAQWVGMPLAQAYWAEACIYLNNTSCSPVCDNTPGGVRATLLNMLTAHIAKLNAPIGGSPSPDQVGRINNASEGGVSVSFDSGVQPGTSPAAGWLRSTKYGEAFWQATAVYRLARYRPGRQPYLGVGNPYGRGGWGAGGGFSGPGWGSWNG
jgi:hypothetical protein